MAATHIKAHFLPPVLPQGKKDTDTQKWGNILHNEKTKFLLFHQIPYRLRVQGCNVQWGTKERTKN